MEYAGWQHQGSGVGAGTLSWPPRSKHTLKVNGPRRLSGLDFGVQCHLCTESYHSLENKRQVWKIFAISALKVTSLDKYHLGGI